MRVSEAWRGHGPLLAVAASTTTVHVVRPAASYRGIDLDASSFEIGVVSGAFALLALVSAIPIGNRIDRYGPRSFAIAGGVGLSCAALVAAISTTIVVLVLSQAILGLGQVCMALALQTDSSASEDPLTRDRAFAELAAGASIGQIGGPLIAGWALTLGASLSAPRTTVAFACAAVVGLLAIYIVWRRPGSLAGQAPQGSRQPLGEIAGLIRRPGMVAALATGVGVLTTLDLLVSFLPVLGEERGLTPALIGLLLSVRGVASLASRLFIPALVQHLGRRRGLSVMLALGGLALAAIVLPVPVWLLVLVLACVGFGLGVGQPLTASWVAGQAPLGERGTAVALRMAGNRLAQLVIPAALGALAITQGVMAVFVVMAALVTSTSVVVERSRMDD
jgi:MFS family permease